MDKKRRIIATGVMLGIAVFVLIYLQWGRDMDVLNTSSISASNFHEERISVTVNKLIVTDKKSCAEEIFKKCRENSFKSTMFSYDVAKPNALYVTVYLSEYSLKFGNPIFGFSCTQEDKINNSYNIVDNPEQFTLKLD